MRHARYDLLPGILLSPSHCTAQEAYHRHMSKLFKNFLIYVFGTSKARTKMERAAGGSSLLYAFACSGIGDTYHGTTLAF